MLLVLVCGLHGNEPAGVLAAARVLDELAQIQPACSGQVVALSGNLGALRRGQRFERRDLNRIWTPAEMQRLQDELELGAESLEMRALLAELEPLLAGDWERIALLDLHSTSASGPPSLICADTLANRRIARFLGMPVLLGLEETLPGTLLSYFSERGHISLCVEGGQNDSPSTVDHHEAAIWLTLAALGFLLEPALPQVARSRACLAGTQACQFGFIEVMFRQEVADGQGFWMEPGFQHCHTIEEGRLLAQIEQDGVRKALHSPTDGVLLMPRYQGQGNDGYFIGRVVRPRWLRLSRMLRRLRLQGLLRLFPSVQRVPGRAFELRVSTPHPGTLLRDLLGLFGYRKCPGGADWLRYLRRPQ